MPKKADDSCSASRSFCLKWFFEIERKSSASLWKVSYDRRNPRWLL